MNLSNVYTLLVTGLFAASSQATLYDRGNGLIYDDVLNVTWLQDANYAQTSGQDSYGRMTWEEADTWANDLIYEGHDNWRLPSANLLNSDVHCYANDGTCDMGYNNTHGELGEMFYTNLSNAGRYDANGWYQLGHGPHNISFLTGGNGNETDLLNLQEGNYWLSEEYAPNTSHAWFFSTSNGSQFHINKNTNAYIWAVHDGDIGSANNDNISAVPIPSAVWLFGTALIGLAGIRRR